MPTMSQSPLSSSSSSSCSLSSTSTSTSTSTPSSIYISTSSPSQRKAMSITQTYYLAHTARGKLSSEAGRSDHNLRLLVGHANFLDSLMRELAAAEDEQEQWFNQSVTKASSKTKGRTHIQWADAVVEDPAEDWHIEDAEAESDSDGSAYESDDDEHEDVETGESSTPLQRVHSFSSRSPSPSFSDDLRATVEEVEHEFEDDGEEDLEGLQLHLTPSRSQQQTPELDPDSDGAASSSEEDESMPPSPPSTALPTFSEKQRIVTTSYYSSRRRQPTPRAIPQPEPPRAFFEYSPRRAAKPGLISAIRVY